MTDESTSCCCSNSCTPTAVPPWRTGNIETPAGDVPQISTTYTSTDRLGTWKVRWTIGRNRYTVPPGIYAVGQPTDQSPVAVTANYKMSFDHLRRKLTNRDIWILVLDTDGINVWCAAGKGTFGTQELIDRIASTKLARIVTHRTVILPQLGATGVDSGQVKKQSGFKVIFGPVKAAALPAFIDAGNKASPAMRQVSFTTLERLILAPVEMVFSAKYVLLAVLLTIVVCGISKQGFSPIHALHSGWHFALTIITGWISGSLLGPILLPLLPGRSFSFKGIVMGLLAALLLIVWPLNVTRLQAVGSLATAAAISSFLLMNFTGASTYASPSGVRREMKLFVPVQAILALVGAALWITSFFIT